MRLADILRTYIDQSSHKEKYLNLLDKPKDPGISPLTPEVSALVELMHDKVISFPEYLDIRKNYTQSNANLKYFNLGPRSFGEETMEPLLISTDPRFQSAHKDNKDQDANGSFDAYFNVSDTERLKIEFKAIRAVCAKTSSSDTKGMVERAMYVEDVEPDPKHPNTTKMATAPFDWNFQQIKPKIPDFFVLVAVFADGTLSWVMDSSDMLDCPWYSNKQHRGNQDEGQLHFNRENFDSFKRYEESNIYKLADRILNYDQHLDNEISR